MCQAAWGVAGLAAAVQDLVQVRGLTGEDTDAFVEVAVAGGLRYPGVPGQATHTHPAAASSRAGYSTTSRETSSMAT
jgi:hypothetical protein